MRATISDGQNAHSVFSMNIICVDVPRIFDRFSKTLVQNSIFSVLSTFQAVFG
jgi:hypothetical protein